MVFVTYRCDDFQYMDIFVHYVCQIHQVGGKEEFVEKKASFLLTLLRRKRPVNIA